MATSAFFRSGFARRCAFVLWLALLLPATQTLAAWHAQSHARPDAAAAAATASVDDSRLAHLHACDLCLTLAGIAHAAPPAVAAPLVSLQLAHGLPQALAALPDGAAPLFAYQGRAPPDAPR